MKCIYHVLVDLHEQIFFLVHIMIDATFGQTHHLRNIHHRGFQVTILIEQVNCRIQYLFFGGLAEFIPARVFTWLPSAL